VTDLKGACGSNGEVALAPLGWRGSIQVLLCKGQHPSHIWHGMLVCLHSSSSSSRRWTSLSWKFWPSQQPLYISLDTGRRLSSFGSSISKCPVWCYPPICTWVFLAIF
jgi:hypothetical protein